MLTPERVSVCGGKVDESARLSLEGTCRRCDRTQLTLPTPPVSHSILRPPNPSPHLLLRPSSQAGRQAGERARTRRLVNALHRRLFFFLRLSHSTAAAALEHAATLESDARAEGPLVNIFSVR